MVLYSIMYIIAVASLLGGSIVVGEFFLKLVINHSPRIRHWFDSLPMNSEEG
jgi:hypothetical protein